MSTRSIDRPHFQPSSLNRSTCIDPFNRFQSNPCAVHTTAPQTKSCQAAAPAPASLSLKEDSEKGASNCPPPHQQRPAACFAHTPTPTHANRWIDAPPKKCDASLACHPFGVGALGLFLPPFSSVQIQQAGLDIVSCVDISPLAYADLPACLLLASHFTYLKFNPHHTTQTGLEHAAAILVTQQHCMPAGHHQHPRRAAAEAAAAVEARRR